MRNILTYWYDLYTEIKIWKLIKKAATENLKILEEHNLRVDWVGRIYTVVNLPDDISGAESYVKEMYVFDKLKTYNAPMSNLRILDLVYPTVSEIKNSNSYLLVFIGPSEHLNITSIMLHLIGYLTFIYGVIYSYIRFL